MADAQNVAMLLRPFRNPRARDSSPWRRGLRPSLSADGRSALMTFTVAGNATQTVTATQRAVPGRWLPVSYATSSRATGPQPVPSGSSNSPDASQTGRPRWDAPVKTGPGAADSGAAVLPAAPPGECRARR